MDEVDEDAEVDQQEASATVIDRCGTKFAVGSLVIDPSASTE